MRPLAFLAAGTAYVALVLFDGVEFPMLSLIFILLAVHEMRQVHRPSPRRD